jgi:ribosomal protein S18 acetylase RimI-like enzyme
MVAGLRSASTGAPDPHVRPLDPWRDGSSVAALLEIAFRDEGIDDGGQRVIHMLRHPSPFDALAMEAAAGFVWVEDGRVVGNASVQRNPTRRDTWVIGNVATHPAYRNRGVGGQLIGTVVDYAARRGARHVALQVVEGNEPALSLYRKAGFAPLGAVTHYRRPALRDVPLAPGSASMPPPAPAPALRRAGWRDRDAVWRLARHNLPDELTYAEPFEAAMYRLGWRWWIENFFNACRDQWLIAAPAEAAPAGAAPAGAARTRIQYDLPEHHVELMLGEACDPAAGAALLRQALKRLQNYAAKPLYSAQARPHPAAHEAFRSLGFAPTRTLVHMRLRLAA